ncbi:putative 2-acylglycerol O-acyltransferase [Helianthus anomalus]
MTHGSDTNWMFQNLCIAYAKWGYAVFAADLIGHDRSDGIHGYIGDMAGSGPGKPVPTPEAQNFKGPEKSL